MDFSRAVTLVADFLQSRNHPFALIGAFALQAYGMVRAADIQFLLSLPAVDEAEVRGYFEKNDLMSLYDDLKRET